jgi:hypothetical protein
LFFVVTLRRCSTKESRANTPSILKKTTLVSMLAFSKSRFALPSLSADQEIHLATYARFIRMPLYPAKKRDALEHKGRATIDQATGVKNPADQGPKERSH